MNLMERMEKKTSEKPLEKAPDNKVKQSEESKNDNAVFRSEQQNIKSGKNEYAEIIDETHKEVAAMLAKIDNVSSSDVETLINDYISENHPEIGRMDKAYIVKSVQNEITGLGLQEFLITMARKSQKPICHTLLPALAPTWKSYQEKSKSLLATH